MNASFGLPSCTYCITLSKEDLERLLETGYITGLVHKDIPCTTSRLVWNGEKSDFDILDRKTISNRLGFTLEEDVADIEGGPWHVQFLSIRLDRFKEETK